MLLSVRDALGGTFFFAELCTSHRISMGSVRHIAYLVPFVGIGIFLQHAQRKRLDIQSVYLFHALWSYLDTARPLVKPVYGACSPVRNCIPHEVSESIASVGMTRTLLCLPCGAYKNILVSTRCARLMRSNNSDRAFPGGNPQSTQVRERAHPSVGQVLCVLQRSTCRLHPSPTKREVSSQSIGEWSKCTSITCFCSNNYEATSRFPVLYQLCCPSVLRTQKPPPVPTHREVDEPFRGML